MVKQVVKYEASDGTLFNSMTEAALYENRKVAKDAMQDALDKLSEYGRIDMDELMIALATKNSDIAKAVTKYVNLMESDINPAPRC